MLILQQLCLVETTLFGLVCMTTHAYAVLQSHFDILFFFYILVCYDVQGFEANVYFCRQRAAALPVL